MSFKTDAFARILCNKCGAEVQVLMPGQPFNEIKECGACKPEPKKKPTRKKVVKDGEA